MSAPKLEVVLWLAAATFVAGCDRAPVVAGTVQKQEETPSAVGGAGGAGGELANSAGRGDPGQAGDSAGATAGMGGDTPTCPTPWWYLTAQMLLADNCRFPPSVGRDVSKFLQEILPMDLPENVNVETCSLRYLFPMTNDGQTLFWQLCDPICDIVWEATVDAGKCSGIVPPPRGAP